MCIHGFGDGHVLKSTLAQQLRELVDQMAERIVRQGLSRGEIDTPSAVLLLAILASAHRCGMLETGRVKELFERLWQVFERTRSVVLRTVTLQFLTDIICSDCDFPTHPFLEEHFLSVLDLLARLLLPSKIIHTTASSTAVVNLVVACLSRGLVPSCHHHWLRLAADQAFDAIRTAPAPHPCTPSAAASFLEALVRHPFQGCSELLASLKAHNWELTLLQASSKSQTAAVDVKALMAALFVDPSPEDRLPPSQAVVSTVSSPWIRIAPAGYLLPSSLLMKKQCY